MGILILFNWVKRIGFCRETMPDTVMGPHEIDLDTRAAHRFPTLDGMRFKLKLPKDYILPARIDRPKSSKDISEIRSSQARSPAVGGYLLGGNNRPGFLLVPFAAPL